MPGGGWKSLHIDQTVSQKKKLHMKRGKARANWNPPEQIGSRENKLEPLCVSHHFQSH